MSKEEIKLALDETKPNSPLGSCCSMLYSFDVDKLDNIEEKLKLENEKKMREQEMLKREQEKIVCEMDEHRMMARVVAYDENEPDKKPVNKVKVDKMKKLFGF